MIISYNNLLKKLIDRGMSKTEFAHALGISSNTMAKISKNKPISMETLLKICTFLQCESLDEVITLKNDFESQKNI